MRPWFLIALLITVLGSGVYALLSTAGVCPIPLPYRLGAYDERFAMERGAVESVLREAADAWETATGRNLFVYDDAADFVVDFEYEERQERAEAAAISSAELALQQKETDDVRAALAKLEQEYGLLSQTHKEAVTAYERRLAAYNAEVETFNATGGAPPQELTRLEKTRINLAREQRSLDETAKKLNTLVDGINELGERGNALVAEYNRRVAEYNNQFGEVGAFTQGEYTGDRIVIYKYTDTTELRQVLAHELGHALGIPHVEEETSIMYYLLEEQTDALTITPTDVNALVAVCGERDTLLQKLRSFTRSMLFLSV